MVANSFNRELQPENSFLMLRVFSCVEASRRIFHEQLQAFVVCKLSFVHKDKMLED